MSEQKDKRESDYSDFIEDETDSNGYDVSHDQSRGRPDGDRSDSESEINDAHLLRSMLQDSEDYYANLTASQAQEEKHCWVCFASEEDDTTAIWVHPCRCRGTTKWVHQACIQRWVDEKQKGNSSAKVDCPQCGMTYAIKLPKANFLVSVLDRIDELLQKICPIVTGGACFLSFYWSGASFGAVTMMQFLGHEEGLNHFVRSDPLVLLATLPLIPVGLIMGRMIRWDEAVLKFLRTTVPKIPLSKYILPSFTVAPERQALHASLPPMTDAISFTRLFCGAIFFPTIASFLGGTLFKRVDCKWQRTILGGATFIAIKGILRVYQKQHTFVRQCQRVILDHNELPSTSSSNTQSANTTITTTTC